MKLTDKIVARLQEDMQAPDLTGSRYLLLRYLARGGMGSVWLVEDTLLQRQLALKVLDLVPQGDSAEDRLLKEARILAGLEHPGIVPVHDAGTLADGRAFYCMKYVEGQTLAEHISNQPLPERLRLLQRIVEPVEFAHARGFIHRDLKPENIMIGAFGEVLVMDWGVAKLAGVTSAACAAAASSDAATLSSNPTARGTVLGTILGTPGYMSPEQARAEATVDHRADIFSLGAVLRFVITRSPPGETSVSTVPRPLLAICNKAMAEDPDARYQTARDLAEEVARYLQGEPVHAYPESFLERTQRIASRHSTALILVGVYLMMRLIFILWARR